MPLATPPAMVGSPASRGRDGSVNHPSRPRRAICGNPSATTPRGEVGSFIGPTTAHAPPSAQKISWLTRVEVVLVTSLRKIINCIMECDSHVWMGSREIKPIASILLPSDERNSDTFHADQLASIKWMIFNGNLAGLRINPMPWDVPTPLSSYTFPNRCSYYSEKLALYSFHAFTHINLTPSLKKKKYRL